MAAQFAPHTIPSDEARALGAEVFVLGFPLVLMDAVRRSHPFATDRFRRLPAHAAELAGGLFNDDPCALQSSALVDLSDRTATLRLPDMGGRYFSLTLIDAAGEIFLSLGSRTRDDAGAEIVLVGPDGVAPSGVRAHRAPSDVLWAVSRIIARGPQDMAAVELLAARQRIAGEREPLEPAPELLLPLELADLPAPQEIASLPPEVLFYRLQQLVARAPAATRSALGPAVAARLGRLPPLSDADWPEPLRQAISRGFADGLAAILDEARPAVADDDGGWRRLGGIVAGDTARAQAARALTGLGAATPDCVLALASVRDESGRALSGDERYRIHFAPDALPPTLSAWRLSASLANDGEAPSAIGDRDGLALNHDGSLDILIQAAAPPVRSGLNWLPAPHGLFRLTMRLYWPAQAALEGAWRMAPVERLGSRFARRGGAKTAAARTPSDRRRALGSDSARLGLQVRRITLAILGFLVLAGPAFAAAKAARPLLPAVRTLAATHPL